MVLSTSTRTGFRFGIPPGVSHFRGVDRARPAVAHDLAAPPTRYSRICLVPLSSPVRTPPPTAWRSPCALRTMTPGTSVKCLGVPPNGPGLRPLFVILVVQLTGLGVKSRLTQICTYN
jgi:hypothetical protein